MSDTLSTASSAEAASIPQQPDAPASTASPFTPEQQERLRQMAAQAQQARREQAAATALGTPEAAGPSQVQSAAPETGEPSLTARALSDVGGGLLETPKQIARGGLEALDAAADGLRSLFTSEEERRRDPTPRVADSIARAETVTGGLVNDVAQFAAGFVGAGKFLKALNLGKAAFAGAGTVRTLGQSALADATAFDAHEERLSNLIQQYPALDNPVTEFLQSRPEDSEALGRFKNAVEGLGIGAGIEGLAAGLRALRLARRGDLHGAAGEAERAAPPPSDPFDLGGARKADAEARAEASRPASAPAPSRPSEGAPESSSGPAHPDTPGAAKAAGGAPESLPEVGSGGGPEGVAKDAAGGASDPAGYHRLVQLTPEEISSFGADLHTELAFGQGRSFSGIRTDLIEGNEQLAATMNVLRTYRRQAMEQAGESGRVVSHQEVRGIADALADSIGDSPDLLIQRLYGRLQNDTHVASELLTYRDLLATIHDRTVRYARALNDPRNTDFAGFRDRVELGEQFGRHVEMLANVQAMYKGVQSNFARALNAMKLDARVSADLGAELHDLSGLAARFAATEGNVKAGVAMARGGFVRNVTGAVNEFWINAILSGPRTHLVNVLSNLATTALQPTERMIAGALRGNAAEFREGGLQFVGLAQEMGEALNLAVQAFRQGDAILDASHKTVERRAYITAERMGGSSAAGQAAAQFLGNVVRLPSRLLTAEDEFFKQLTFRARVRAQAMREAMESGLSPGSREWSERLLAAQDAAVDSAGRAVNPEHIRAARSVTFTDSLQAATWSGGRTLGETLQGATASHPLLAVVMPFVRTPTNILRFVHDRTPGLNLLRRQYVDDLLGRNGEAASGMARAKMASGGLLWGGALTAAFSGSLTGGGPSDPQTRRALEATGWKPYSFRHVGEDGSVTYSAYSRLDPFGMFFGLAADFAEVGGFLGEREREQVATDMVVALARNLQDKSYLSGLTRAVAALAQPDRSMSRFLQGVAGSFVPAAVTQTLRNDPHLREVHSLVDALRNRLPGYSRDLDPVRNILGEVVNVPTGWGPDWLSPVATGSHPGGEQPNTPEWRHTTQDRVEDEIARQLVIHGAKITPPPALHSGVDLRQFPHPASGKSAYDRLQALVGEVRIGGRTLRERLAETIQSPTYRNRATDGDYDRDGSRIDILRRTIGAYRQAAETTLRRELPELHRALRQAEIQGRLVKVRQQ